MSQGNQSYLRFSLEESVWFQRGQEVEELVSISLDPNITIQENDQYVTIRGSLDLTGEYKRQNEQVYEEDHFSSVQKWIHSTEEREDGICEFSHQFPVDITIPTYRVRDLTEIDVIIETFDYVLPEKSCLKLTADLNISGLYGEHEERENVQEDLQETQQAQVYEFAYRSEVSEETEADSDYESFEVEARKEDTYFSEPTLAESSSYQQVTPEVHFAAAYRNESPQDVVESPQNVESPQMGEKAEEVEVEDVVATHDESPESSPNVVEKFKKKLTAKKSMSISEFLARKEGDDHAKLKVCIVQNGESAEVLAERYDVPVQQLLKVNNLEPNQDVYEGQVLYVPNVAARR